MNVNDVSVEELAAYKEAVRVMLGFRTIEEVEATFRKPLVQAAIPHLERALFSGREQGQPDEFALATAVEMTVKEKTQSAREDLNIETIFNDPKHHQLPDEQLEAYADGLWRGSEG
ncbi:MAG: hypothetical protein AAF387_03200 [Pseudomonadota bacterium]